MQLPDLSYNIHGYHFVGLCSGKDQLDRSKQTKWISQLHLGLCSSSCNCPTWRVGGYHIVCKKVWNFTKTYLWQLHDSLWVNHWFFCQDERKYFRKLSFKLANALVLLRSFLKIFWANLNNMRNKIHSWRRQLFLNI